MNDQRKPGSSFLAACTAVFAIFLAGIALIVANGVGTASTPAAPTVIDVTLSEFSISPKEITVPPGLVSARVTNRGSVDHNFGLKGGPKTRNLKPGESATLELGTLKAGHVDTFCDVAGHEGSGMKGMIMVVAGTTAAPAAAPGPATDTGATSWQQMDKMMSDVGQQFLDVQSGKLKVAGQGNQLLDPRILADGTKEFDLTAAIVDWEVEPGKMVKAWTYNAMVPGPVLRADVGDKIKIHLVNNLPESTSMHLHGIRVPNSMDGVDPYTQDPIPPGGSFDYVFTAMEPGVGMYHSHHNAQVQIPNGMAGALYIGQMDVPAWTGVTRADVKQQVTMVLNDAGTIGLSLNGKSFPATQAYAMKVGEVMEVTYMNEGLMTHPMHLHQPTGMIIAKDGKPVGAATYADTIPVAPGERFTVLYKAIDPGVWAWHCHILTHAETPDGMKYMVTALIVS